MQLKNFHLFDFLSVTQYYVKKSALNRIPIRNSFNTE